MKNPGIINAADGCQTGDPEDIESVVEYSNKLEPDLIIVLTAPPMYKGLVDKLLAEGFNVFGSKSNASLLECDKAYARDLMKNHKVDALPEFKVFTDTEQAFDYAEYLDWQVAVKPNGLTEGLGVKVYGDQLENPDDIKDYIYEIIEEEVGGEGKVIIEEKLNEEKHEEIINKYIEQLDREKIGEIQ